MQNALISQEKKFQEKEISQLTNKNDSLEQDLRKYMEEAKNSHIALEVKDFISLYSYFIYYYFYYY